MYKILYLLVRLPPLRKTTMQFLERLIPPLSFLVLIWIGWRVGGLVGVIVFIAKWVFGIFGVYFMAGLSGRMIVEHANATLDNPDDAVGWVVVVILLSMLKLFIDVIALLFYCSPELVESERVIIRRVWIGTSVIFSCILLGMALLARVPILGAILSLLPGLLLMTIILYFCVRFLINLVVKDYGEFTTMVIKMKMVNLQRNQIDTFT
jgi:hypothetical protein